MVSHTYDTLKDCEMIVSQVHRAFNNPSKPNFPAQHGKSYVLVVVLPWAIQDYTERLSSSQNIGTTANEERLRKDFPLLYTAENGQLLPLQEDLCIVLDSQGIIVLWYMPSSFSMKRNVS